MTRDSESLIEVLICILIATTLVVGAGSERWSGMTGSSKSSTSHPQLLITAESIFMKRPGPGHNQPLSLKTSPKKRHVEKISGLIELNELLFAKPLKQGQNRTASQSC